MSQPEIHAVVFDLDGLMLNTEDVFEVAGRELVARRGKEMTTEVHNAMLGRRPHEAFTLMCQLLDIDESFDTLFAESREIFASLLDDILAPMPGLFELLERVESVGLPKAVATSSPRNYMHEMLGRYELNDRFTVTLTAEDVSNGKPDPEVYQLAASRLGVETANMLVLEDSEVGTRAASSAGAFAVSVPNRHTANQDFSMCSLLIGSLEDERLDAILAGQREST